MQIKPQNEWKEEGRCPVLVPQVNRSLASLMQYWWVWQLLQDADLLDADMKSYHWHIKLKTRSQEWQMWFCWYGESGILMEIGKNCYIGQES